MDRIKTLCSYLDKCRVFADVACDHGYCAEYMLRNNLCAAAVISDISDKSLSKARTLLSEYISNGKCTAVCCDGLEKIDGADFVLIAGIGGEEIVKILKNAYIPQNFLFQPMKNAELVRAYLLDNGCNISDDDIFSDGKNYYFLIKGSRDGSGQNYSKAALAYGRDSLINPLLRDYLKAELNKKEGYLSRGMKEESSMAISEKIKFIQGVLNGEIN